MIEYRNEIPLEEGYARLFKTTGWNQLYQASPAELLAALNHSWYVVAAYDGDVLIGFGRVVSDQVIHAMIYDMIVHPEYQNCGIGGEILERLVRRCQEAGLRDVQLFCALGKQRFYEKHGFVARSGDAPGMQVILAAKAD
jgi:GNAT superfamily N-acetyltransferase